MSPRLYRCLCLLSVCSFVPCLALGQRYSFKYYSHEQGLEDLTVSCLLPDRTGFLWLGTMNGLYRYDGARFQLAEGLPSTRVFSLAETADGSLLVATREGLAIREGSQFRRVGAPEMRAFPGPQSVAVTPEGTVYVAAPSGLWVSNGKVRPTGMEFRKYVLPRGAGDQGIFSAYSDARDGLWFGCGTGLCQLAGGAIRVFDAEADGRRDPGEEPAGSRQYFYFTAQFAVHTPAVDGFGHPESVVTDLAPVESPAPIG